MTQYPWPKTMLVSATFIFIAWCLLLTLMILFGLALLGTLSDTVAKAYMFWGFMAFIIAAISYIALALSLKCPTCGKSPTIQGFSGGHKQCGQKHWAIAIMDALLCRQFKCIHCGTHYKI